MGDAWGIVLAGGDGARLLPLTGHISGESCPKQFCAIHGSRTLLGQTLARIAPLFAPERTVVVGSAAHESYLHRELSGRVPYALLQPSNKGTGAGILWPVHWVSWREPDAVVVIFPSDHFVLQERAFLAHVARAVQVVRLHPDLIVLLGVAPDRPEEEYGWIEPGEPVAGVPECFLVRSFWEKPTAERARAFFRSGFLWNSLVVIARAEALMALGRRCIPNVHERLSSVEAFAGSEHERWALQQAYAWMHPSSFSRDVLERSADSLAVLPVHGVLWSDLGTPERVVRTFRRTNVAPPWLDAWVQRSA
jgi:mannose-1-phosphate guanylyltransferase